MYENKFINIKEVEPIYTLSENGNYYIVSDLHLDGIEYGDHIRIDIADYIDGIPVTKIDKIFIYRHIIISEMLIGNNIRSLGGITHDDIIPEEIEHLIFRGTYSEWARIESTLNIQHPRFGKIKNMSVRLDELGDELFFNTTQISIKYENVENNAFSNILVPFKRLYIIGSDNIGAGAFSDMESLEHASIDAKSIGYFAFENTPKLKSLSLTNPKITFSGAFVDNFIERVSFNGNLYDWFKYEKSFMVADYSNGISLTIEDTSSFGGVTDIIRIPSGITDIAHHAMYKFRGFKTLIVPPTVTHIGRLAFAHTDIESIIFEGSPGCKDLVVEARAFSSLLNLREIQINRNIVIDKTDRYYSLGEPFVCSGSNLNITIGGECTVISERLFCHISHINELVISDKVEVIKYSAFLHANQITNINISAPVKRIEDRAFAHISGGISKLVLPSTLEKLGDYAFFDIGSNLKTYFAGSMDEWLSVDRFMERELTAMSLEFYTVENGGVCEFRTLNINEYNSDKISFQSFFPHYSQLDLLEMEAFTDMRGGSIFNLLLCQANAIIINPKRKHSRHNPHTKIDTINTQYSFQENIYQSRYIFIGRNYKYKKDMVINVYNHDTVYFEDTHEELGHESPLHNCIYNTTLEQFKIICNI